MKKSKHKVLIKPEGQRMVDSATGAELELEHGWRKLTRLDWFLAPLVASLAGVWIYFHIWTAINWDDLGYMNYSCYTTAQADAWAHPGLFFKKNPTLFLSDEQLSAIFKPVEKNNILIEINEKYNLPPQHWLKIIKDTINKDLFVRGSDIHSVEMLNHYSIVER